MFTDIIRSGAESRNLVHGAANNWGFQCHNCGIEKPVQSSGGTGYAVTSEDRLVCYECCAKIDAAEMRESGRAVLYLTRNTEGEKVDSDVAPPYFVSNWPGTLKIPVWALKKGYHNLCGRDGRTDFWFRFGGREWHGVNIGHDSQIARCRALKG